MQEFYDASEARAPELREREQFAKMPELIARAMSAPGWAEQLAGVEANRRSVVLPSPRRESSSGC